eukprot:286904_1
MQCQTRSLRLATSLRVSILNKQFIITSIKLNTFKSSHKFCSSTATQQHIQPSTSTIITNLNISHPSINIENHNKITTTYKYDYEIRLGPVTDKIPTTKLLQLSKQCGNKCILTKTRNSKALYIQTNNENDIPTFQSLIHSEFLQHKTSIDAGDKTRFIGGKNYENIDKLHTKTGAFIYLSFLKGQIEIYGNKSSVNKARELIMKYLSKIIFIELDGKISWVCARNHWWVNQMTTNYKCEIYSEPTGRLIIIAEPHITKQIMMSVNNKLTSAPPDSEIKNKKVHQYKLAQKIQKMDNISDVIRAVRNNHNLININNIHSIMLKLSDLRWIEMEQEKTMLSVHELNKYKNISSEQQFDNALSVRRKKNTDYMYFMAKIVKKLLPEINDIGTIALCIWCFSIFDIKRFDMNVTNNNKQNDTIWPLFVNRVIELYKYDHVKAHNKQGKNFNHNEKKLYSLCTCLIAFSTIHPIKYDKYKSHLSFILKELHLNVTDLNGSAVSRTLEAITNDDIFLKLCLNCSFLVNEEMNIWKYLCD